MFDSLMKHSLRFYLEGINDEDETLSRCGGIQLLFPSPAAICTRKNLDFVKSPLFITSAAP